MYEQFYQLKENPFQLSPDTEYLFLGSTHSEALSHLVYAVQQKKGIALLTGEIGAGKTTLCHALIRQLGSNVKVAHLVNSKLDSIGLFRSLLFELNEEIPSDNKFEILRHLQTLLLKHHHKNQLVLMIIDEAQNLSAEVLEEMRMLSNIETEKEKPIQILLVGQPELRSRLNQPELEQLRQRITVRYHLSAMNEADSKKYIEHRLQIAASGTPIVSFSEEALKEVYFYSSGIPRLINTICDNALLAGYVKETNIINGTLMKEVIAELIQDEVLRQPLQYTASSNLGSKHYYGFRKEPFISQPDNREFLFLDGDRGELMGRITNRIEHSSIVQAVLGAANLGKTTLAYALMESLRSGYRVLYIDTNGMTNDSFVQRICNIAGVQHSTTTSNIDLLWDFCKTINTQYDQKRKLVILFDNLGRHNNHLSRKIAELFRSLNSLMPLPVKFIMFGDHSLQELLTQWQKQISAVDIYPLLPFTAQETESYIRHRLRLASNEKQPESNLYYPFIEDAIRQIYHLTEGIPLRINRLCQSALELGYIRRQSQIDTGLIEETAIQLGYSHSEKLPEMEKIGSYGKN
jgi:general secretion pathway protein A